jgi:putative ABC transport system ATP-binding protein
MLLTLRSVTKTYATSEGPLKVLDGVDLVLEPGQTLALTGESGSGKSTLLHLAAGLDTADAGSVTVAGQDVAQAPDAVRAALRRGTVGLVFQQFNLIPSLDVAANLSFQARLAGRHDPAWTQELADALGLSALLTRYPEQLSGGQQQRVAIARSLVNDPRILLADEPTGALDQATGAEIMALFQSLNDEGRTVVLVTHDRGVAEHAKRRIAFCDGQVLEDRSA